MSVAAERAGNTFVQSNRETNTDRSPPTKAMAKYRTNAPKTSAPTVLRSLKRDSALSSAMA